MQKSKLVKLNSVTILYHKLVHAALAFLCVKTGLLLKVTFYL